jgi:hypothetical protein
MAATGRPATKDKKRSHAKAQRAQRKAKKLFFAALAFLCVFA